VESEKSFGGGFHGGKIAGERLKGKEERAVPVKAA
jgi:hypothetical protein